MIESTSHIHIYSYICIYSYIFTINIDYIYLVISVTYRRMTYHQVRELLRDFCLFVCLFSFEAVLVEAEAGLEYSSLPWPSEC